METAATVETVATAVIVMTAERDRETAIVNAAVRDLPIIGERDVERVMATHILPAVTIGTENARIDTLVGNAEEVKGNGIVIVVAAATAATMIDLIGGRETRTMTVDAVEGIAEMVEMMDTRDRNAPGAPRRPRSVNLLQT